MRFISSLFKGILFLFMLLAAIGTFPSISSILLILICILVLPIRSLQRAINRKFNLSGAKKVLAVIVLFVVSAVAMPETEPTAEVDSEVELNTEVAVETTETESTFSIQFIDVGQADAALVECDGQYMLIDGGNKSDSDKMYTVLKENEITHLDMIVGTHAHEDHIGGIPGALNYATVDKVLCPVTSFDSDAFSDFKKYSEEKGKEFIIPKVGENYTLGTAKIEILGVNEGNEVNDTSIVLKINYGETSFLFTGDAEKATEEAILANGGNLSATVLKVGHHGSETAATDAFIREVAPEYAVISVGDSNVYGHPSEEVLNRLKALDVTVYRTDLHGDIMCTSDGEKVTFSAEKSVSESDIFTKGKEPKTEIDKENDVQPTPVPTPVVKQPEQNTRYYILNTNTMKFHYPSCSSVGKIKSQNRAEFTGTREEIVSRGYSACGNCHP